MSRLAERLQCLQIILRQADIITLALDHQAEKAVFLAQTVEGGCKLKFTVFAHVVFDVFAQVIEQLGLDDVLAEHGQVIAL